MRPKILVIRGGAIGDFILTLPAIKLLRDNFPAAHLEILGYPHILALAEGRFYADAIRSIEYSALAGFFIPGSELAPDLVEYFSEFHQVVSYLYDPDFFFETNLRRCGVKNLLSITPLVDQSAHAALQLARPLEQLALYLDEPKAEIFPSESDRQFASEFLGTPLPAGPIIAIHPGSGSPRKNWPIELWGQLADWLLAQSASPARTTASPARTTQPFLLILGGEADEVEISLLAAHISKHELRQPPVRLGQPPVRLGLACNLKLPHLAAIIERASLFLGHDSGISHIAAAVKTRSILMFGPTEPSVWAPVGEHIDLIRADGGDLRKIKLEEMQEAISKTGVLQSWIF